MKFASVSISSQLLVYSAREWGGRKQTPNGYRRPALNTAGEKEGHGDGTGPLESHSQTHKVRNRDRDNLLLSSLGTQGPTPWPPGHTQRQSK